MTWQPLKQGHLIDPGAEKVSALLAELKKSDPSMTEEKMRAELAKGEIWINDTYAVAKYDNAPDGAGGRFIHLSIKRQDREPIHDWRDLQRIKTELCGAEAEGVEIYPAESRVVDMANQYHLWVFTKLKLPWGFRTNGAPQKKTAEESARVGSKNREGA